MNELANKTRKSLQEALEIERGQRLPKSETIVRDGVILEIRQEGILVFSLTEALNRVAELRLESYANAADFLKSYREIVHQTQETMARLYGVDVSTFRNWEQGHRSPGNAVHQLMAMSVFEPRPFFRMAREDRELIIER